MKRICFGRFATSFVSPLSFLVRNQPNMTEILHPSDDSGDELKISGRRAWSEGKRITSFA